MPYKLQDSSSYQLTLKKFRPERDFFIGIDSDGSVFNTMELKQKGFFIPNALKYFNLYPVREVVKETWEFVNLYSVHRGGNRYISLVKVFELLQKRKEIIDTGCVLPDLNPLKSWIKKEQKLEISSLKKYNASINHRDTEKIILWSENINLEIKRKLHSVPFFPHAVKTIKELSGIADLMVVSQTPMEALQREWHNNNILKYVKSIAGQEHGTKSDHIALAAKGKYPDNKILMIGDAFGDLEAARNNGVLFWPIIPGKEDDSWNRFRNEGINKFMSGNYTESYEKILVDEFFSSLPENPEWI